MNSRDFNNLMEAGNFAWHKPFFDDGYGKTYTKFFDSYFWDFRVCKFYIDSDNVDVRMTNNKLSKRQDFILKTENGLRKMMRLYDIL